MHLDVLWLARRINHQTLIRLGEAFHDLRFGMERAAIVRCRVAIRHVTAPTGCILIYLLNGRSDGGRE